MRKPETKMNTLIVWTFYVLFVSGEDSPPDLRHARMLFIPDHVCNDYADGTRLPQVVNASMLCIGHTNGHRAACYVSRDIR